MMVFIKPLKVGCLLGVRRGEAGLVQQVGVCLVAWKTQINLEPDGDPLKLNGWLGWLSMGWWTTSSHGKWLFNQAFIEHWLFEVTGSNKFQNNGISSFDGKDFKLDFICKSWVVSFARPFRKKDKLCFNGPWILLWIPPSQLEDFKKKIPLQVVVVHSCDRNTLKN